jgi:hypothetical protein
MKCERHCENVHLQIGKYNLKYHMFSIYKGGCDIVLFSERLHTLGPIQTPQGLPPFRNDRDHSIPLISRNLPTNIFLCCHPFSQKNEIEKIIHEFLEVDVIFIPV